MSGHSKNFVGEPSEDKSTHFQMASIGMMIFTFLFFAGILFYVLKGSKS